MAGIFPPQANGGKPPGPAICNGFTPTHHVIGEGPSYIAADCTTVLTDCNFNAIVSELLAAVDRLGFPYNAGSVTNLGDAIQATITEIYRAIDARVLREGDTMEGPLILWRDPQSALEAVTKRYVDQLVSALNITLRAYIDAQDTALQDDLRNRISVVDAAKINRAGDTMAGPLILARDPVLSMEAATKASVQAAVEAGGGGGGGGGGGIPDAPWDDRLYGRINQTWQRIIDDGEYS